MGKKVEGQNKWITEEKREMIRYKRGWEMQQDEKIVCKNTLGDETGEKRKEGKKRFKSFRQGGGRFVVFFPVC